MAGRYPHRIFVSWYRRRKCDKYVEDIFRWIGPTLFTSNASKKLLRFWRNSIPTPAIISTNSVLKNHEFSLVSSVRELLNPFQSAILTVRLWVWCLRVMAARSCLCRQTTEPDRERWRNQGWECRRVLMTCHGRVWVTEGYIFSYAFILFFFHAVMHPGS